MSEPLRIFNYFLSGIQCQDCTLSSTNILPISGSGNLNSKYVMIGEAPGALENEKGEPFVGKSGQLLNKILSKYKLHLKSDFYITNSCKCRPVKNRTPKESEYNICKKYLKSELMILKPKVIICLGKTSVKTVLGRNFINKSMSMLINQVYLPDEYFNLRFCKVLVLYHPAALIYNNKLIKVMEKGIKLLKNL